MFTVVGSIETPVDHEEEEGEVAHEEAVVVLSCVVS